MNSALSPLSPNPQPRRLFPRAEKALWSSATGRESYRTLPTVPQYVQVTKIVRVLPVRGTCVHTYPIHTPIHSSKHACTHAHVHALTRARARAHTHIQTHTHTHPSPTKRPLLPHTRSGCNITFARETLVHGKPALKVSAAPIENEPPLLFTITCARTTALIIYLR